MKISKKTFGVLSSGKKAALYTLEAGDLTLTLTNYGAHWAALTVPSRKGPAADILLGYSTLDGYTRDTCFLGATIGRFGNRIGGGKFTLNGTEYSLYRNDGPHSLHGGRRGFNRLLWDAEAYEEDNGVFVRLELKSPSGDEGYPGRLKAVVRYGLTASNEIIADYQAKADAPCPVNFTNHAYFNLAGEGSGDILSHQARLYASSYVAVDETLIPTGKLAGVQNTPFDFREAKPVKRDMAAAGGGYDHCFVVDGEPGKLRPCAEVYEETSGRTMRIWTTQPGIQFYTGNFLNGVHGKAGSVYHKHGGFCLETQHLPDSPNRPEFPSAVFGPDRDYHERALFAFEW